MVRRKLGRVTGFLKGRQPDPDCKTCHGTGWSHMMVSGRRTEIECGCIYKTPGSGKAS